MYCPKDRNARASWLACTLLWPIPDAYMSNRTRSNNTVLLKTESAQWVIRYGLCLFIVQCHNSIEISKLTMTGGSSAVCVRDIIGCSTSSLFGVPFVVKLELDLNLDVCRLSVRCLVKGTEEVILFRNRSTTWGF